MKAELIAVLYCDVDKQRQASLKLHASLQQQQQQPKSAVRAILSRTR